MKIILSLLMTLAPAEPVPLTPQQSAQIRAQWCADRNHYWHPPFQIGHVWSTGARFEGAGWRRGGDWKTIGTCRPHQRRRMRVIADAHAISKSGMIFRIRLFK